MTLFERTIVMTKKFADKSPILFSVIVFIVFVIVSVSTVVLFTSLFGLDMENPGEALDLTDQSI